VLTRMAPAMRANLTGRRKRGRCRSRSPALFFVAAPFGASPSAPQAAPQRASELRAIAAGLNARGIPPGTGEWQAGTVAQLLAKLA
jgi:hypothetical protein